jgi:hypothetical protein
MAISFIGGGNRSTWRKPEYVEKTGVRGENHRREDIYRLVLLSNPFQYFSE